MLVTAVINSGPREDSTRIGRAGTVRRQAVDVSPLRRVNQAVWLLCMGAREAAFRNIKSIAECLADELINAAKVSGVNNVHYLVIFTWPKLCHTFSGVCRFFSFSKCFITSLYNVIVVYFFFGLLSMSFRITSLHFSFVFPISMPTLFHLPRSHYSIFLCLSLHIS